MIQSDLSEGDSDPNKALIEQGSVITLSSQMCLVMGWDQGSCGLIENFFLKILLNLGILATNNQSPWEQSPSL